MSDLKPCPTCDKPRCCHCDFTPFAPGADWGHLEGPKWSDYCQHVSAMRYCDSCSQNWWQVGLEGDWDIDGCAKQDCPECVAANAAEKEDRMGTCATCDGSGAVDAVVNGARGQDSCPACDGTGTRRPVANDAVPPRLAPLVRRFDLEVAHVKDATGELSRAGEAGASAPMSSALPAVGSRLAPLVSAPPTMSLSAAVAACVASAYGQVRPRLVDPDEVTVVARFGGGVR